MIDLFLLACITVNYCIIGHILGALLGQFIGKLANCVIGFEITFKNENTGYSETVAFRWYEAWTAQGDIERLHRHLRDNQAAGR